MCIMLLLFFFQMSDRRKAIYAHFLNVFSFSNDTLKDQLLSIDGETRRGHEPKCLIESFNVFRKHCSYEYYVSISG